MIEEKTLGIELPYDKCNQCSLRNPIYRYQGLDRDVSWGEYDDFIEIIFISDKGTNPGYGNILSPKEGAGGFFYDLLKENQIKNFLMTAVTLCRSEDGESPSVENISCCHNNLEIIIETAKKMNQLKKKNPPILVVLGITAAQRFFTDFKKKDLKIKSLSAQGWEYNDCPLFVTYHPASFKENENFRNLAVQDILSAYRYYKEENQEENDYMLIENLEEFDAVMDYLMTKQKLVYDIETTGNKYLIMRNYQIKKRKRKGKIIIETLDDWHRDTILGISFSAERNTGIYLPLWIRGRNLNEFDPHRLPLIGYNDYEFNSENFYFWLGKYQEKYVIQRIKELLENPKIEKCNHNIKFDNEFLITQLNINPVNVVYDTMNAIFLLNENVPKALEFNVDIRYPDLRGYKQRVHQSLTKEKLEEEDYGDIPLENLWQYGARDADATFRLWEDLQKEMAKEKEEALKENPEAMINNEWLMENFYKPIVDIYTRAEIEGIPFDKAYADKLADEMQIECDQFQEDADYTINQLFPGLYPNGVNFSSWQQLQELLFNHLQWPVLKTKEKRQDPIAENASTDKSHMKELLDYFDERNIDGKYDGEIDFIKRMLDFKGKKKFISTYLRGKAIYNKLDQNNKLHTSYLFYDAGGRFSSKPNVQNIPRDKRVRGIFYMDDPENYDLFGCDLSQAELRIMAWYANDLVMIDWINRGVDIHWEATRDVVFGGRKDLIYDENDPKMKDARKMLKTGNFGRLYGAKTDRVMKSFRDRLKPGEKLPDRSLIERHGEWFFGTFFRIAEYLKEMEEQILRYGYIDTIFGRRRHLPDAFHPKEFVRQEAVRSGINAQIQGTASDMTQYALIRIDEYLRKNNMKSKFLFSIHDELMFKIHKDEKEHLSKYIPEEMVRLVGPMERVTSIKLEADGHFYNGRWGW